MIKQDTTCECGLKLTGKNHVDKLPMKAADFNITGPYSKKIKHVITVKCPNCEKEYPALLGKATKGYDIFALLVDQEPVEPKEVKPRHEQLKITEKQLDNRKLYKDMLVEEIYDLGYDKLKKIIKSDCGLRFPPAPKKETLVSIIQNMEV